MPKACSCKTMVKLPWSGRKSFLASVLLALLAAGLPPLCSAARKHYSSNWLVEVKGGWEMAEMVAKRHHLFNAGQVGALEGVYHFAMPQDMGEYMPNLTASMAQMENVTYVEQQVVLRREKRSELNFTFPSDPLWSKQWYLFNGGPVQKGRTKFDLNVLPAWIQGYSGRGVVVSVVDEGVQISHPDLSANIDLNASHNYVENKNDPSPPNPSDSHGTSCAGEIAMGRDNNKCGVGVAYHCSLGAIRVNLGALTDITEANALSFNNNHVQIYTNSWGPIDNGFTVAGPEWATARTLQQGVKNGRNGLGNIYVWASGNGGANNDSCAADGYSSSVYTISVGSASQDGKQAFYDEDCSGKMATTYSFSSDKHLSQISTTTTKSGCISTFTGTSASAPMAAGTIALALEANPHLTWRDVQYLLAYTSNPNPLLSAGQWTTNGAGLLVSHQFGFGAIDAEAMVTRATRWINVPPQQSCTPHPTLSSNVSRKGQPLIIKFSGSCTNLAFLEHVVVTMTLTITLDSSDYDYFTYSNNNNVVLEHTGPKRGDISIELLSPTGTKSVLLPRRTNDYVNAEGYENWPFMSVHHWGENPAGNWVVNVSFASNGGHVTLNSGSLSINLYGTNTVPEAISRIPSECSPECARNCSGEGPENCDACKDLRRPDTLECVSNCSFLADGSFCEVDGYCLTGEICDPSGNVLQGVYIAVIVLGSLAAISVAAVCLLCVYVIVKRRPVKEYLTLT